METRVSTRAKPMGGVIKRLNNIGYVQIKVGIQWMEEHRLICEEILGRQLEHNEVIHHIDFNKQNNNPNNLALFKSQQSHAHWHRQVRQFGLTRPLIRQIEERRVSNLKVSNLKVVRNV